MDGVGKPRSYGKYEIFDDERDVLSWDAAEKRAHDQMRAMGIPIPSHPENVAIIPPRPVHPELDEEQRSLPRAPKPEPRAHTKLGDGKSSLPPAQKTDHKLEAIARAHILLHFIKTACCKEHPDHAKWIDEILDMAPKSS